MESECYSDLPKLAEYLIASLVVICDTRQVGADMFYRLNTSKVSYAGPLPYRLSAFACTCNVSVTVPSLGCNLPQMLAECHCSSSLMFVASAS